MKGRLVAFASIGAMGFLVQMATIVLLSEAANWPYAAATAVAVELAILHNFWWHEQWTWRGRALAASSAVRLARFHLSAGCLSLLGNVAATVVLVENFHLDVLIANALAVAFICVGNFLVADRWVFAARSPSSRLADLNARRASAR